MAKLRILTRTESLTEENSLTLTTFRKEAVSLVTPAVVTEACHCQGPCPRIRPVLLLRRFHRRRHTAVVMGQGASVSVVQPGPTVLVDFPPGEHTVHSRAGLPCL